MPGHEPLAYTEQRFDRLKGLDGISDGQIAEHLELYSGYVKQVNVLNEALADMENGSKSAGKDPRFAELIRRLGFEYNGMILHEYYFGNLRPGAAPRPPEGSKLAAALQTAYGSFEDWSATFQAIGAMRGVGWAVLLQDPVTRRLSSHWISLHEDGVPAGFKPLLVMDVWEHAFMRDYRATERDRYIDAFFRNVDWQAVDRRLIEPAAVRLAAS